MNFVGKVAVVTGGGSGIGQACVIKFAALGATVAIVDIDSEAADATVSKVEAAGGKALAVPTDITDYSQVVTMAHTVRQRLGQIDILVNNAGWDRVELFMDNDPSLWDRIIDVNLKGTIYCTRAVLEHMLARGVGGRIVNVASDAGRVGSIGEAAYSASKGGVVALTKTIAREMARAGILVNCTCPSPTATPLLEGIFRAAPGAREKIERATPLRRLATAEDQADAIVWLASEEASFITGQTLSVNGGLHML